ncbi:hypothetical protein P167DRAFT_537503 [Morchella conica CCBAS932]|uniref:Uncharacterized protein n=1 Tax=Morchella conica CCBAS932 TaxID=1392247 RepID=A0A3N4KJ41_9PEZI|nr:hypothetical protein P167DRAFT_537503 [Morchella conica CCBAS932]
MFLFYSSRFQKRRGILFKFLFSGLTQANESKTNVGRVRVLAGTRMGCLGLPWEVVLERGYEDGGYKLNWH